MLYIYFVLLIHTFNFAWIDCLHLQQYKYVHFHYYVVKFIIMLLYCSHYYIMPHGIRKFENEKQIIIDVRNSHASDTKCEQMMEVECHAAH